jgi:hypothetical protein
MNYLFHNYLKKTKRFLDGIGYKPNEEDLQFLETYKKYYVTERI